MYEKKKYFEYLSNYLDNETFNNILVSSVNRDEACVNLKTRVWPSAWATELDSEIWSQGNTLSFRVFQQIFPHLTEVNGNLFKVQSGQQIM